MYRKNNRPILKIEKMQVTQKSRPEEVRKEAFESSKFDPFRSKFGLFSHPGFIATSEDTYARPLRNHRDPQNGKVTLGPKNFIITGAMSKTHGDCFSIPKYECDLYKDPPRLYQIEKERATRMYQTNTAWKHSGFHSEKITPYNYEHDPIKPVKNHKEPDGTVKTGPKGFFTTPAKRGHSTPGVTIGKVPEHVIDPYESYENWLKSEKKKQLAKRIHGQFTTTEVGGKNFTNNKELYNDQDKKSKGFKDYKYDGVKHPKPFMHTNPIGFTINQYPDHFSNDLKESKSSKKIEVPWRHTGNLGTSPHKPISKLENYNF